MLEIYVCQLHEAEQVLPGSLGSRFSGVDPCSALLCQPAELDFQCLQRRWCVSFFNTVVLKLFQARLPHPEDKVHAPHASIFYNY